MVDLVATLSGEIRRGTDTASTNSISGGGSAANTAAWLGATGKHAVMIGAVGTDALGAGAIADLEALGVVSAIERIADAPTGTVIALVHPDGERTMFPDAGANLRLSAAHVEHVLRNLAERHPSVHLHVSGYTLLREPTRESALMALRVAHELGVTTSVDPSSTGPIDDVGVTVARDLFSNVDLVIANDEEALLLARASTTTQAAQDLTACAPDVIVKCGAAGSLYARRHAEVTRCEATTVEIVDTLGAGDAFAAGALPAWRARLTPTDVLAAGAALAATCVQHAGARPAAR